MTTPAHTSIETTVYSAIHQRGPLGLTSDEAEQLLHLTHQTCSARFNALARRGSIVRSSHQRKTRSGRFASVWVAPEFAAGAS